jgi:excisionase family DNA binding protein
MATLNTKRSDTASGNGAPGLIERQQRGLLSVNEAAKYLRISPGTMRNWLSMRKLEHVKVGRLTRISCGVLDRYVADHTVRAEVGE